VSTELHKRAEAIRAHYKEKESHPGTGYHDDDRNLANPQLFAAPQKNGLPRASEHVVAFFDYPAETVHFVGPDAERVAAAMSVWKNKCDGANVNLPGTNRKLFHAIIPALKVEPVEGQPRLTVRLANWNDVIYALQSEGVGITGAHLTDTKQDPATKRT
jgi:hypothetical protein